MTTWGDEEDFKHFLPRILELWSEDEGFLLNGADQLWSKLESANWREWPENEKQALKNVLDVFMTRSLVVPGCTHSPYRIVDLLFRLSGDIEPLLRQWEELARTNDTALEWLTFFIGEDLLWYGRFDILDEEDTPGRQLYAW